MITHLMRHDRSLVALEAVLNRIDEVPTELVFGMLDAIVGELNAGQKPRVGGLLDHELEETFKALDKRDLHDTIYKEPKLTHLGAARMTAIGERMNNMRIDRSTADQGTR